MRRRTWTAGLVGSVLLHVAVVTTPAVVLAVAAHKGGVPGAHGVGLLLASGGIGVVHGVAVWQRLWRELRAGVHFASALIATFDALVVLALGVTLLLFVVLGGYAPTAAILVNSGWPVVTLWVVVQLAAVAVAEFVRVALLRWLEPDRKVSWVTPRQTRVSSDRD